MGLKAILIFMKDNRLKNKLAFYKIAMEIANDYYTLTNKVEVLVEKDCRLYN